MQMDIVIPAHNEEQRIDRTLKAYRSIVDEPAARFVVALDCCTDGTAEVARSHARVDSRVEVFEYPKLGKGGVLMESFRRCEADLVGFVDADCATPPAEFLRLVDTLDAEQDLDGAIASRSHPASVLPVHRSLERRMASRVFSGLTRAIFGLPFGDTQCGAKVVRRRVLEGALPLMSSRDFLFDVDLLVTAGKLGFEIVEVPTIWLDQAGSHLSATADAKRMAASSLRLWLNQKVLGVPQPAISGAIASIASPSSIERATAVAGVAGPKDREDPPRAPKTSLGRGRGGTEPRPDVAIVSPYPRADGSGQLPSGVARYSLSLTEALADAGLNVRVVAPRVDGEPELTHRPGITVERSYSAGAGALPAAARAARRSGAPVVHLQHEVFLYGGPSSVLGLPVALSRLRLDHVGPVVTMHQVVDPAGVDREFTEVHRVQVPAPVARAALSSLQRGVRGLAAATIVHERAFSDIVPDAVVVPLGLHTSERHPKDEARSALGLDEGPLVALCFGFLSPYKGLEAALDAAEIAGPSVQLVVAGGEHPRLAGRDTYAADLARRYGGSARFTGYVEDSDLASYFSAADVVLLPYPRPFASSGPFAEALGFGTPVLCSPALGACIGLPDEMVAPIEPDGLAGRLLELVAAPERLERLENMTSMLAGERTWKHVAERHVEIYEEVIDANRTPRGGFRPAQSR
ncbi:MAG: hypothetical protein JWO62_3628 [Acidimicrobiaceae bacterium]|nr:hypothetical protein [Acidimicrobiaceae bacterium]